MLLHISEQSAETLQESRWAALRARGGALTLAITQRRAATLKARAYDHDVARVIVPRDADAAWVKSVSDPADDLNSPMKGPLSSERDGSATAHRASSRRSPRRRARASRRLSPRL